MIKKKLRLGQTCSLIRSNKPFRLEVLELPGLADVCEAPPLCCPKFGYEAEWLVCVNRLLVLSFVGYFVVKRKKKLSININSLPVNTMSNELKRP